jgi:CubicO group peptidase (beta-lactamase class C family)
MLFGLVSIVGLAFAAPPPDFTPLRQDATFQELFLGNARVTRGEDVLFEASRGEDRSGAPLTADSVHWVGSISKHLAATAMLALVEAGKVKLEDPVARHIPEWPPDALSRDGATCTLELLLSHQCGIPREVEAQGDIYGDASATAVFLEAVRATPLDFTPGTYESYSNAGYQLAGLVVQRLAGVPYGQYLRDRLFAPLGLKRTGADRAGALSVANVGAAGHFDVPYGLLASETWLGIGWDALARRGAAGNAYATPRELERWFRALNRGEVLTPASVESLTHPRRDEQALGLVRREKDYGTVIWHNGAASPHGHNSFVGYAPASDTTVVVLMNRGTDVFDATTLGFRLMGLAHDQPWRPLTVSAKERWLGGLPGLVWVGMGAAAAWFALRLVVRPARSGPWGDGTSLLVAAGMAMAMQGGLDRFRSEPPLWLPWCMAAVVGLAALVWRRWRRRELPAVAASARWGPLIVAIVLGNLLRKMGLLPAWLFVCGLVAAVGVGLSWRSEATSKDADNLG